MSKIVNEEYEYCNQIILHGWKYLRNGGKLYLKEVYGQMCKLSIKVNMATPRGPAHSSW